MADAFSVTPDKGVFTIEEDSDTGHVLLSIEVNGKKQTVEVDAEDLTRAMFTGSRTFTQRVAEYVHRALINSLG